MGNYEQLVTFTHELHLITSKGLVKAFVLCFMEVGIYDGFKSLVSLLFLRQLFKGKFFYCLGPDVKNITNKSDCLQANFKWVHHKYNFDNLGQVSVTRVLTAASIV